MPTISAVFPSWAKDCGNSMKFVAKYFDELTTAELYEILKSRAEVFFLEQKIFCLDMDDVDYKSRHCFIEDGGRVIAYLRAYFKDGDDTAVHMGRVLTLNHGMGHGARLMQESIADIKESMKCERICLDSQKHAIGFYEKLGFCVVSDEFLEEGVVHVCMELVL